MTLAEARQILGLPERFDEAMLKTAHRRAVKRAHPDLGGSKEDMVRVTEAYETLRNPQKAGVSEMLVTHNGILDVILVNGY